MARKVKWTAAAWSDLEEAADYIARDSPNYAAALVREVREAARSLSRLAERGPDGSRVSRTRNPPTFSAKLSVDLSGQQGSVDILAIVHGARDLLALRERGGWDSDEGQSHKG